jgi:hypothetical protein
LHFKNTMLLSARAIPQTSLFNNSNSNPNSHSNTNAHA